MVFPGGRSVVSSAPVCCCGESEAVASDRQRRRRSERGCVEVLRSESAKEQDSARRGDKWCIPGGRTVMSRVPVHCCWESGAVTSDRREGRRSERSYVEGLRSGTSGYNRQKNGKKGRHVVGS
jgi:hypothetical protein